MSRINHAYTEIMSFRFKHGPPPEHTADKEENAGEYTSQEEAISPEDDIHHKIITKSFIKIRETAKDALYRYFQYSLYNFHQRVKIDNQSLFNRIVTTLQKSYHLIKKLEKETDDTEFIDHFSVFNEMIFNFYRASECINIFDSYTNQYEVDAYRLYRQGDEELNYAQKEIFFDRHNRGSFKKGDAHDHILNSIKLLMAALNIYSKSTWSMEMKIKLEYAISLKQYLELFFQESN